MHRMSLRAFMAFALLLLAVPDSAPAQGLSSGQTLYAPVYSRVYYGAKAHALDLFTILSVRNTDPWRSMTVDCVEFYNDHGALVRQYLKEPQTLGPMATAEFRVTEQDRLGGSGANFLVRWSSSEPVNPPLVEAVMIGASMGQGISFTSRAVPVEGNAPGALPNDKSKP